VARVCTISGLLEDPARTETVVTRAFTGRPVRGLRSRFIDTYEATAPLGYPAVHFLTSPLKAAAAASERERVHLWAGTGYRHARRKPTAQILAGLAPRGPVASTTPHYDASVEPADVERSPQPELPTASNQVTLGAAGWCNAWRCAGKLSGGPFTGLAWTWLAIASDKA
jgi:hypothetical protein